WSLQSLRRRGIRPAALREFVLSFGLSLNDIEVPAETLYAENRKLIDKDANRYFFVPDPVAVEIDGLPPIERVKAPLHPDFPGRGVRAIPAGPKVQVAREDFEKFRGKEVRLKDFCNVVLDHRVRCVCSPGPRGRSAGRPVRRPGSRVSRPPCGARPGRSDGTPPCTDHARERGRSRVHVPLCGPTASWGSALPGTRSRGRRRRRRTELGGRS